MFFTELPGMVSDLFTGLGGPSFPATRPQLRKQKKGGKHDWKK